MALWQSIDRYGMNFPLAYHRVTRFETTNGGSYVVHVEIYVSDKARQAGQSPVIADVVYSFPWTTPLTGQDPVAQAYGLLLTAPDYAGAKSV